MDIREIEVGKCYANEDGGMVRRVLSIEVENDHGEWRRVGWNVPGRKRRRLLDLSGAVPLMSLSDFAAWAARAVDDPDEPRVATDEDIRFFDALEHSYEVESVLEGPGVETRKERGCIPIPYDRLAEFIDKPVYLSWQLGPRVWILKEIRGDQVELTMPRAWKTCTARACDVSLFTGYEVDRETRKYAWETAARIKARVFGQDFIIDRVASLLARRRALGQARKGPLATILVSGPPGTGKSEIAKAVSAAVFGTEEHMLNIQCEDLGTEELSLWALVGAPRLYTGSRQGAIIEYLIENKGEGVILFDHLERFTRDKEAPVAKMMLTLLEEGTVRSQYDGQVYDAKGCVIILTRNLKQTELRELSQQTEDPTDLQLAGKLKLKETLAPEFFDRIALLATTMPVDDEARSRILEMRFRRTAESHGVDGVVLADGFHLLLTQGVEVSKQQNVRAALRWLENLADEAFINAAYEHHWHRVIADWDGKQIVLRPVVAPEE
jgi:DNA polymerase III delta prime subunit